MNTSNLDYLRSQVTDLKKLLDDPHPGLSTWCEFYSKRMQAISDFWNADDKPAMKKVWKFLIEPEPHTSRQSLMLPEGAQILTVQVQGRQPRIWVAVNPEAPLKRREIEIFGTGQPMDEAKRVYIGTFQQDDGLLIWHVFERL